MESCPSIILSARQLALTFGLSGKARSRTLNAMLSKLIYRFALHRRRIFFASSLILFIACLTPRATAQAQVRGDVCHVYIVDVAKAQKAFEDILESGDTEKNRKAAAASETVFPEFRTVMGEEELTTKTYTFPGSNLFITASVYYTDESMASSAGSDSMLLAIVVSPQAQKSALSVENNAVSEVTLDGRDAVRAKTYVKVNGRLYLSGIECRSKPGK